MKINFWNVCVSLFVHGSVSFVYTCEFILCGPKNNLSSSGSDHLVLLRSRLKSMKIIKRARVLSSKPQDHPVSNHQSYNYNRKTPFMTFKMFFLGMQHRFS